MDKAMSLATYLNKMIKATRLGIVLVSGVLILSSFLFWYLIYAPINPSNFSKAVADIRNTASQNLSDLEKIKYETQLEKDLIGKQKEYIEGLMISSGFSFSLFRALMMVVFFGLPFFAIGIAAVFLYKYKKIQKMLQAEQAG
ncbi:MAG: hypothetical protein H6753_06185 [Candidatus Omnitrophica bacterium]|nr:hypothetical protein [Candidatus Omnitrophota bacterium]